MARPKQVFVAPGSEDEDLSSDSQAWMHGRSVYIPLEYWTTALEFGETLDKAAVERLTSQSGTAFVTSVEFEATAYQASITFLEQLIEAIRKAPNLIPEVTEEFPDAYPNSEIAQMLTDVKTVFEEAFRLQQPLKAWDELLICVSTQEQSPGNNPAAN